MTGLTDKPNIIAAMRRCCEISDETLTDISKVMERKDFAKRQLLVEEGCRKGMAFFIEEGMTRSYWVVDGEEVTTSFSTAGAIVFSMDEVYYDKLSEEFVETIDASTCYAISLPTLKRLINDNIELARWWSVIHQNEYRRLHRSHKERLTLAAPERYAMFRECFPEVCRRARLCDIASYLGITLSTLSRIRRGKG